MLVVKRTGRSVRLKVRLDGVAAVMAKKIKRTAKRMELCLGEGGSKLGEELKRSDWISDMTTCMTTSVRSKVLNCGFGSKYTGSVGSGRAYVIAAFTITTCPQVRIVDAHSAALSTAMWAICILHELP